MTEGSGGGLLRRPRPTRGCRVNEERRNYKNVYRTNFRYLCPVRRCFNTKWSIKYGEYVWRNDLLTAKQFPAEKLRLSELWSNKVRPVSYTHLDVYKRQMPAELTIEKNN